MRDSSLKLLALLLLLPSFAGAQVVRGQLLNGETGLPLEGALIILRGEAGEVGTVLSNAAGRFLIQAPGSGSYQVRADRIGHASTTSEPFTLAPGDTVDLRLVAEIRAIRLEGLEVAGERRCEIRPEAGRAVATVWEEARKALAAAAFTEAGGYYRYRTIRHVRELDRQGRRVLSEERRASQGFLAAPFESLPAETLMAEGFFRADPEGDLYFAPDAEVLLSDPFLDTHCLGLTVGQGETAGLLGVAFEPIGGRDLPEVRGVVWVEPSTGQLRHVDFTYENLDPALRNEAVGGRVAFQGLPDGTWIVREWRIRMPNAALAPDYRGGRQVVLTGIREEGGTVDLIQDQDGKTIMEARRAAVAGVVLDETGLAPLAGASVRLLGTSASALTGPDGAFHLTGLGEGVFSVTFSHPSLPPLEGVPEPVEVELKAGQVASVRVVAPSIAQVLAAACGEGERPEESAVLTGLVRDGETGEPLPGAEVRILWTDFRFRGTGVARGGEGGFQTLMGVREDGLQGRADASGRYLACAVPRDHPLTLEAEAGGLTSGVRSVRILPGSRFLQEDISIVTAGTGALLGRVVDWESGEPLEGVSVTVHDPDQSALTNENGSFRFPEVPLGLHLISTNLLGRAPLTDTIRIRPDRTLQLELRLPSEALEIEGITVEVLSQREMEFRKDGFSGGRLDVLTPAEMDVIRDRVSDMIDILRSMGSPRVRVTDSNSAGVPNGFCIQWTRREASLQAGALRSGGSGGQGSGSGCTNMLIVLDGIPQEDMGGSGPTIPATDFILDLTPEEIESVRVLSPVQARFEFGARGDRGALIIETRRGGRGGV